MSTNYYVTVFGVVEDLHFGKSSAGWVFSLRVHPERGIHTLYDWTALLADSANTVRDEYGRVVSTQEMLDTVMNRKGTKRPAADSFAWASDSRETGEGSWDYCNYEFC